MHYRKGPRFVDRAPTEPAWRAVHRAADVNISALSETFTDTIDVLTQDVPSSHLQNALSRGSIGMALGRLNWDLWRAAWTRAALPVLSATMQDAAEGVGRITPRIVKQHTTLEGVFDQTNPRAVRVAAAAAATMVTGVSQTTIIALRDVIVRGQALGLSVFQQANEIERILRLMAGLDAPRAITLANFEAAQIALGVSPTVVAQRVNRLRDQLLRARALTIARHETMNAANAGQVELWDQAEEQGFLPTGLLREWIITEDRRLCPICAAMRGQTQPRGSNFFSSFSGLSYERPPAHILCRCAMGLVIDDD